jgi:acid stress-induced BolA-like protein IbaG/YrbA
MKPLSDKKLQNVLGRELDLADAEFHLEHWGRKISGSIVSRAFAGMGDTRRQQSIWDALQKHLGPESTQLVGMLLAFTPDEWNAKLEGHGNGHGVVKVRTTR